MKFPAKVQKGILIQRYKRFLADIDLDGQTITAHCANPGSMAGVKTEGSPVWVNPAQNPNRKLKWDWQVIEIGSARACINTAMANPVVEAAINSDLIPELSGYGSLKREVKYGENSRIDIFLTDDAKPDCYVEVKNVTLSRKPGLAEFPDSPTKRGTKHLFELANMSRQGHRAVMFYLVNRTDCEAFSLARDIDPEYGKAFDQAQTAGVEMLVYGSQIAETAITIGQPIKLL